VPLLLRHTGSPHSSAALLPALAPRALAPTALAWQVDGGPSPGEVGTTFSDNTLSRSVLGFVPRVGLREGAQRFAAWFNSPHNRPEFAAVATRRRKRARARR